MYCLISEIRSMVLDIFGLVAYIKNFPRLNVILLAHREDKNLGIMVANERFKLQKQLLTHVTVQRASEPAELDAFQAIIFTDRSYLVADTIAWNIIEYEDHDLFHFVTI